MSISLPDVEPVAVKHHVDPIIDALTHVADALAAEDAALALTAVEQIAVPAVDGVPRRPLPIPLIARIFQRDHFRCRYCGKRTVPTAVLRAISSVPNLRDAFPYHPAKRTDSTHPAYRSHGATCDHVVPMARGGSRDDPQNLTTACWECNRSKADQMLEQTRMHLLPITTDGTWSGLTNNYRAIWGAAGRPDATFHGKWMRGFGL